MQRKMVNLLGELKKPVLLFTALTMIFVPVVPALSISFQPAPHFQPLPPHYPIQRARDVFGEKNENHETAYPLPSVNRTYQAALDEDDLDWYSFTVPASGLGSWVQVTVRSVAPANAEPRYNLVGPDLGSWETIVAANGKMWCAAKAGLTMFLAVSPEEWPQNYQHLDYNITLQSGVIPDADTSVDETGDNFQNATVVLSLNEPKQAYMAAVGDATGHEMAAFDWFIYPGYKPCTNYRVQISRPGLIVLVNPEGSCSSGNEEVLSYSFNDDNSRADCTPPLWVGISYKEAGFWSFSGIGDVPERYKIPYTITLSEEGPASNDTGCDNP